MKDKFVHLHTHSTYSFQDGIGLPEQYTKRALELGQPGLGITDHGNISAHYKWYKHCKKAGIVPILGCEFYIVADDKDIREREYNHITVLVKNNTGYKNLTKLVTKAWCEQFYYKPRITYKDLFENQEGLIVLSGCLSSPAMQQFKKGNIKEGERILNLFNDNIENFYIEIQPINFPEGKIAYDRLIELYNKKLKNTGFKIVATNDCHYVKKEQNKLQEILLCIQSNDTMDNKDRWKFDQDDFYLKSREEMEISLKECFPKEDFTEALDATVKIAESIDFEFPKATPIKFPMPEEEKVSYLYEMCKIGMVSRGLYYDSSAEKQKLNFEADKEKLYKNRLDYELSLIVKKGFIDYFLVIADLVQWAKSKNILVGPARGSAAGSLACYALAITEVEPIRWSLIFERFIDINREDLPDIDIDFEDARRHEVKEYLENKYGKDRVGNLPTFSTFKGKSAIDDISRVFKIPFKVAEKVKSAIIERSGGDSRASFTLEDTFNSDVFEYPKEAIKQYPELKYAIELEGQYRQIGQHAAGVVISNETITDFGALYKIKDSLVNSLDYKDITDIGLLKIDILGLNTLSVISNAIKLIKERTGKTIEIYNLPLTDQKTYKGFVAGKLFGIFQFDGQAVNQVCRQIMPKDFESLSAISALARPGPLNSGNTTEYIMRKNKKKEIIYVHPIMESITGDSYGIVIYQEQVMRIMREIGKMSWKDTSDIRKLISRSQGVEKFNSFREKFIPGALENGLSESVANKIWDEMCHYGCLSGDSKIKIKFGHTLKLKDLYKKWSRAKIDGRAKQFDFSCYSLNKGDGLIKNKIIDVVKTGVKKVYKVTTTGEGFVTTTMDHKFLTPLGWKKLEELTPGDLVAKQYFRTKGRKGREEYKVATPIHNKNFYKALKLRNKSSSNSARYSQDKISKKSIDWWNKNPKVKIGLINRIPENKLNTWGMKGVVSDGHVFHSLNEKKLENWLIKNKIDHTPHPIIRIGEKDRPRKADQLVKGFYLEMDGMGRSKSFWNNKYKYCIDKLIVIKPTEKLDLKLKFLKDKKLSYLGSKKKLNNHREIVWKMIRSIKYSGKEQTYDICMESPYNSFIANNFIVHNSWSFNKSHSVSYTIISYWTMWLKIHYPMEFYGSILALTDNEEKKKKIIKEFKREGFKVLPISINESKEHFSIEKEGLRIGFSDIKGIGPLAAEAMVKNQPYISFHDFLKKLKERRITETMKVNLINLGAFDCLGEVSETKNIFGEAIKEYEKKPMEFSDRFRICPWDIDFGIDNNWLPFIKEHPEKFKELPISISDLKESESLDDVVIYGIVYDKNLRDIREVSMSKGKSIDLAKYNGQFQFANFVLEDDTDFITIRISNKVFPEYGNLIFEQTKADDVIVIRGRMGSGIRMFFMNKMINLRHYKEQLLLNKNKSIINK